MKSNIITRPIKLPANGKLAKTMSILFVGSLIIGALCLMNMYNYPPGHTRFTLQNIGRALEFVQLLLVVLLSSLQEDAYKVISFRPIVLDERQAFVRRRIFEKSYKLAFLLVFAFTYIVISSKSSILPTDTTSNDIYWLPFSFVVLMFALPPIFAAWQKDS